MTNITVTVLPLYIHKYTENKLETNLQWLVLRKMSVKVVSWNKIFIWLEHLIKEDGTRVENPTEVKE